MTVVCTYFSPTTPTATTWSEDLSDYIRLGGITGLSAEARLGATGVCSQTFDDAGSTIGHAGDGIVGLKQMFFDETACPAGNQRMWTGYIGPRTYRRGQNSLRLGADREIEVALVEVDDFLSFRVFAPEADDPTSDFAGLEGETDLERVQRLLTEVDFLSTTLFDIGYIPSTGGVEMSAKDYTGARPIDVLNDCAQVSGRNFFVLYDETGNQLVLWYDDWKTDGSATLAYDSALRLTNVDTEHDGSTTFAVAFDANEVIDPSRVISAVYLPWPGGTAYNTLPSTANTFAWRDAVMQADFVKDAAKATSLTARYLGDNATEDPRIFCTVQLPAAKVTGIHKGQRLQVHFTHLPNVSSGFTWTRVMALTIRQDKETPDFYWLDLELSPIPTVAEPSYFTSTNVGGCEVGTWPEGSVGAGFLLAGYLVTRDLGGMGSGVVPIGNGVAAGSETCDAVQDIAGTGWTYDDSEEVTNGVGQSAQQTTAHRDSVAGEPQVIRWGGAGGLAGTARPRSHQIALPGISGAPTVSVKAEAGGGAPTTTVLTSPPITVTGPGYIVQGFCERRRGPGEGIGGTNYTLTARAPATELGLRGWAYDNFGPYSHFCYLYVSAAMFAVTDTYTIILDRSGAALNAYARGWMLRFWPE